MPATGPRSLAAPKPGYLYVMEHPSHPGHYKIGKTTRHPDARLAEHNSNFEEYTGRIVKETGQKWTLKTFIEVADTTLAESEFWGNTSIADIPFLGNIEVHNLEWGEVQKALEAVKKAKFRPPSPPQPDWVYAYTAWMKKRLEGRDIELVRLTTSRSGKSIFKCVNGHKWRTRSDPVGNGEGCPECGVGTRTAEEVGKAAGLGVLSLLKNPAKPGLIKIAISYGGEEDSSDEWQCHRHRFVEDPALAERLMWELLGQPKPADNGPVEIELSVAEQAIRDLIYRMHSFYAARDRS